MRGSTKSTAYDREASPTTLGWARDPSPVRRESPEPAFGFDEQTEIEDERWIESESEVPEPRETRGINEWDNKWRRKSYDDGTAAWGYDNKDGSRYEKNRDGTRDFDDGRGFSKHYPAPALDEPFRRKEHGRDARDKSPRYPVVDRNAPKTGRGYIQQPELADFVETRTEGSHKYHRQSQPTADRWASPSPPPPPSTSQRPPANQRLTKTRNQESAKIRRAF